MTSCTPLAAPLVFVDLETSGANFALDRIIEVGLVEVDVDGSVREWSSLVNPDKELTPFITHLTGIDSAMLAPAPRFAQLAAQLSERLRGRLLVAHNARFDYGFLKHEFKRSGIDFRATSLCTVKLSRKLFPEHHRHSLETLIQRHGIHVAERHRALADARVLWQLWQDWSGRLPAEQILAAIDLITGRPELPPWIDAGSIEDLPEAPGAYVFFGESDAPLLIKRAANLRRQVFAHFSPDKRDSALVRDVRRVEWRESAGELGARLCEIELAAPTRRHSDELCSWRLIRHGQDDFRPQLVFAREVDFAHTPDLFGLYASRREATQALRRLAEAQRLCHTLTGLGTGKPGEACVGVRQKTCRGACVGKEAPSAHSARLMAALAKYRLQAWPYDGPIACVERDEFGMREDLHVIDAWRHLGSVQDEESLLALIDARQDDDAPAFDPEIYRLIGKTFREGKLRIIELPRARTQDRI